MFPNNATLQILGRHPILGWDPASGSLKTNEHHSFDGTRTAAGGWMARARLQVFTLALAAAFFAPILIALPQAPGLREGRPAAELTSPDEPVRLARAKLILSIGNVDLHTDIGFTFTSSSAADGSAWIVGDGRRFVSGETGSYDFHAGDDPDFPGAAALLSNGRDDRIEVREENFGLGVGGKESVVLDTHPDVYPNAVDFLRLVVLLLYIASVDNRTWIEFEIEWQIWGHAAPPGPPAVLDAVATVIVAAVSGLSIAGALAGIAVAARSSRGKR